MTNFVVLEKTLLFPLLIKYNEVILSLAKPAFSSIVLFSNANSILHTTYCLLHATLMNSVRWQNALVDSLGRYS